MLSENQALRKREKLITWLIAIVVALTLLIAFVVVIKNQKNGSLKMDLGNKMILDVQYWPFPEGYTTPVITIANPQNITRQNCKAIINDKYIFEISEIPPSSAGSGVITINTNNFTKEDGTMLDSASDPARLACIICREPLYSSYCGNFAK